MIDAPESFELTKMERQSPLWQKLEKHYLARLAALRIRNDGPHDELDTAYTRGQIAVYKALTAEPFTPPE